MDGTERDGDVTRSIAVVFDRLSRLTRGLQRTDGLNPAQWEALRYLAHARPAARRPGALAEYLGSTRGTVSQTLIALEHKGLIERHADPADGRAVGLELTDGGRALAARDPLAALEAAAATLDGAEGAALLAGLVALLRALQAGNREAALGVCRTCRFFGEDGGARRCYLTGQPVGPCGVVRDPDDDSAGAS